MTSFTDWITARTSGCAGFRRSLRSSVSKLPSLEQFQGIVQKLLGEQFRRVPGAVPSGDPGPPADSAGEGEGQGRRSSRALVLLPCFRPRGPAGDVCFPGRGEAAGSSSAGPTSSWSIRSVLWRRRKSRKIRAATFPFGPVAALVESLRRLRLDASLRDEHGVGRAKHLPLFDPGSR